MPDSQTDSNAFAERHHHGDNPDCGYCKDIRSTITRLEQERDDLRSAKERIHRRAQAAESRIEVLEGALRNVIGYAVDNGTAIYDKDMDAARTLLSQSPNPQTGESLAALNTEEPKP